MELTTILSIAIPVVSGMTYLSGWYFGKAEGMKEVKTNIEIQIYKSGFADGKIYAAKQLNTFAIECKKKYEAGSNL